MIGWLEMEKGTSDYIMISAHFYVLFHMSPNYSHSLHSPMSTH